MPTHTITHPGDSDRLADVTARRDEEEAKVLHPDTDVALVQQDDIPRRGDAEAEDGE